MTPSDRVFAGIRHGHAHYWCSAWCKDNDCEFGPCCFPAVKLKRVESAAAVVADDLREGR